MQAEWKRIGPAPRQETDALWQRFRSACDRFFDRRNRREELEREDALRDAAAICDDLDAVVGALSSEPAPESDQVGARIDAAWTAWIRLDVAALGGADDLTT